MFGPNARIMKHVVMALAATAMLAAGTSASQFMYDASSFVFGVMENDNLWKEHLWVKVKVDTAMVPAAVINVLEELGVIKGQSADQTEKAAAAEDSPPEAAAAEDSPPEAAAVDDSPPEAEAQPKAESKSVVMVNALLTVAEVVSSHRNEGELIEFAMSVIASAIKCNTLQYLSVQLRAVDMAMSAADADRGVVNWRISAVGGTLVSYLDKLSRLKESLDIEAELYREWETVAIKWSSSEATETTATELLHKTRKLVDGSLNAACEHSVYEQFEARLGFTPEDHNWDSPEGVAAIFEKCQTALNSMFTAMPISTMDLTHWDEFFDKSEKLNELFSSQMDVKEIPVMD